VTRLGPLRLVTFAGGRGIVTYRDLEGGGSAAIARLDRRLAPDPPASRTREGLDNDAVPVARRCLSCASFGDVPDGYPQAGQTLVSARRRSRPARSAKSLLESRVVAYGGEVVVSARVLAEPR
jgi:hypothetical protein